MVLERSQNGPGAAVIFVDIDGFKLLNDAQGHHTGDDFLRSVAQRLSDAVPKNGLLCRWGADEFVLLLDQVGDRDSIAVIVQALFNSLARPLRLEGHELIPSACVGISFYPEDAANAQGLIQGAETALYRAKERGPANIELFTPLLAERLHRKFEVASELRRAIQNNELMLHYQPQVDSKTAELIGVEALVRWQHPTKGLISPVDFIQLAEELGLIELLGDCVLNKGLAQMARWQKQGCAVPRLAVNISPQQLVPGFAKKIHQLLGGHRLPANILELEITEGALERDDSIISLLNALRDMGVLLSIDDFGTGYSSLAHIKHLPITCFKIDKAFVDGLPHDAFDVAIIRTVLALGHSLGISVLAEGVETEEQHRFLAEQGVDSIQGYYFGKPMAANALEHWIASRA
jgi:diguanylate cyclase (GGDEF)-like protein